MSANNEPAAFCSASSWASFDGERRDEEGTGVIATVGTTVSEIYTSSTAVGRNERGEGEREGRRTE